VAAKRGAGVSQDSPVPVAYPRYADFLDGNPGRRGDALGFGHDWIDGADRYRVCWYAATEELTISALTPTVNSPLRISITAFPARSKL
jgi:hypothetical protein